MIQKALRQHLRDSRTKESSADGSKEVILGSLCINLHRTWCMRVEKEEVKVQCQPTRPERKKKMLWTSEISNR